MSDTIVWHNAKEENPETDGIYVISYKFPNVRLGVWKKAEWHDNNNGPDGLGAYSLETPEWWTEVLPPQPEPEPEPPARTILDLTGSKVSKVQKLGADKWWIYFDNGLCLKRIWVEESETPHYEVDLVEEWS